MCHALVEIKWTGSGTPELRRVETPDELETLVESLESNVQVMQYRTWITKGKRVRVPKMESQT